MSPLFIISTIALYLGVLLLLSFRVGRKVDNAGFFIGNRRTKWPVATLAMIGAAMSGVTYVSLPASVASDSFSYMQMAIGFTIGQLVVAFVLVPIFYRLRVVSLYEYLDNRFDNLTHRAGALCFIVSKLLGASLKIYVVCAVLQMLVYDDLNIHFSFNILFTMLVVYLFTFRGGVRSLIVTDVLQSLCLVSSIVVIILFICNSLGLSSKALLEVVTSSSYSQICFLGDTSSARYFWKMVAGGALSLVAMTGLDQDMMQRNLSCCSKRDSQINIVLTAACQIVVILLFLVLGVLLYAYLEHANIPVSARQDDVFPMVAVRGGLPIIVGVMFITGLVSSTYSAAGSALTSLTTSFTLDIMSGGSKCDDAQLGRLRRRVHLLMAVVMTAVVMLLAHFGSDGIINLVFKVAGYTYGPILGLFVFGLTTKHSIRSRYLPFVVVLSPALSYMLQWFAAKEWGYFIGFELLGYNALFCIFGLLLISYKNSNDEKK
ncbi:MAG: sodium:solute symporter [Alistipes sp.]|nr:sodium:solute symporter [Alistipes sp.]